MKVDFSMRVDVWLTTQQISLYFNEDNKIEKLNEPYLGKVKFDINFTLCYDAMEEVHYECADGHC